MQDEMTDLLEQANDIQESMSRSYTVPDEIDEAELEAGMSNFDATVVDRELSSINHNLHIPELEALSMQQDEEVDRGLSSINHNLHIPELEALSMQQDEEPGYLDEVTTALPDFIDEAPIEVVMIPANNDGIMLTQMA